jgi:hypothetical protein
MVAAVSRVSASRAWPAAAAIAAAVLYVAVVCHSGPRLSSDSGTYSRWADALIALDFNYRAYLTTQRFVVPPVLYVAWITIVALAKVGLRGAWPSGIVFLNCASAAALVYGIARTTSRLTLSVMAGLAAAVLCASAVDVLLFLPFVLSDVMFMALSGVILLLGLVLASEQERHLRPRRLAAAMTLLLIACVFRPTAPPLVVFLCACMLIAYGGEHLTTTQAWGAFGAVCGVALLTVVAHAALMQDPSRWPGGGQAGWIRQLSGELRAGIVVFGRPQTYAQPPQTLLDFVMLTLKKWAYYFAPWAEGYSRFHIATSAAFFLTTYVLSVVAVFRSPRWRLTWVLVLYVAAFSLFHALQQIDYDFRYRLPIIPALSVLAALGLEQLAGSPVVRRRRAGVAA